VIYRKRNQDHLPYTAIKIPRLLEYGGPGKPEGREKTSNKIDINKLNHILFDSEFESGNIDQVRQLSTVEYDIWMRNDTNGSTNLQWFFFRMRNPENFRELIRINIVNFTKGNSLFYYVSIIIL